MPNFIRAGILAVVMGLAGCATPAAVQHACFHLNPSGEKEIGYCQAVRSGNTLYVSGSVGSGAMPDAIAMACNEIKRTLQARGLGFQHVVSEHVYTTNLDEFIKYEDLRKPYYGANLPAATWVQVQRLYDPSFVVEIEVTAEFSK